MYKGKGTSMYKFSLVSCASKHSPCLRCESHSPGYPAPSQAYIQVKTSDRLHGIYSAGSPPLGYPAGTVLSVSS